MVDTFWRKRKNEDEDVIFDEGKVKYVERSGKKQLDDLFEVDREEKREQIKEERFRRKWKI